MVKLLPAFQDNYIFVIPCKDQKSVIVVDPGDSSPVEEFLSKEDLSLAAIILTHHHHDHIDGVIDLQAKYMCDVYGNTKDQHRLPPLTHGFTAGDDLFIHGLFFKTMDVPGHTIGHVMYYLEKSHALFCGDTLFSLGCGRLFEGSYEQMFASLQKIKKLPPETQIYCTHEYTLSNGRFALNVDPQNQNLKDYLAKATSLRAQKLPTVPTNLKTELECNPFLRTKELATFTQLRQQRNHF